MSKIKKTWVEKRDCDKEPLVKINPKSWSDMPKGHKDVYTYTKNC